MSIVDRIAKVLEALKVISWDLILQLLLDIIETCQDLIFQVGLAIATLLDALKPSEEE